MSAVVVLSWDPEARLLEYAVNGGAGGTARSLAVSQDAADEISAQLAGQILPRVADMEAEGDVVVIDDGSPVRVVRYAVTALGRPDDRRFELKDKERRAPVRIVSAAVIGVAGTARADAGRGGHSTGCTAAKGRSASMDPVKRAPRWYGRHRNWAGILAVVTVWFIVSGALAGCSGGSPASDSAAAHVATAPDTAVPAASAAAAPATTSAFSSSPAPAPVPSRQGPACNSLLWKHVYHPYRLHIISTCKTVRGTVEEVRWEPDGDLHVLLRTSPSLVNADNRAYEHGDLVLEEICKGTVTQADAVAACRGLSWKVTVPSVGDTVTVIGTYVLDADHGWLEIHPVSKLTVTGHAVPAPAPTTQAPSSSSPPSSSPSGCHPRTSSGNCYEPGEFCSTAEHGETGVAGDGKTIKCENTDPGSTWHWVAV